MKNGEEHIEFREQAVKYLAGEMSASEKQKFSELLKSDREMQKLFSEYSKIWGGVDGLAAQSKYDLDSEWTQLSGKIDFNARIPKVISLRTFMLRIAAAVLIGAVGLAGWIAIRNISAYEQVASEQETEVVTLPDGSVVTLNAGSTLKYAMENKTGNRMVILSGEAYFEVSRDTLRPFIIDAGSAMVEVLGTSFNVSAYKRKETVEVTVNSGLVAMTSKRNTDNQIMLKRGNSGIYNKDNRKLELIDNANPNAIAWKTRELVFFNTPLIEVVEVLNHVYHSEIVISDQHIANCTITVSFSKQELQAVISVLSATLDLEIERNGQTIMLSGEACN